MLLICRLGPQEQTQVKLSSTYVLLLDALLDLAVRSREEVYDFQALLTVNLLIVRARPGSTARWGRSRQVLMSADLAMHFRRLTSHRCHRCMQGQHRQL